MANNVRIYEPGADTTTRPVEALEQPDGSLRQVVRVPQTEAAVAEATARLDTIRDQQRGYRAAAPQFVAPSTAGAVAEDRFRLSSTGRVSMAVAGNLRGYLRNAATTDGGVVIGRAVQVLRIAAFTTSVGWAELIINPTTGLPPVTARRTKMNALLDGTNMTETVPSAADPVELRVDVDATVPLGGGVPTGITFGLPQNARTTIDLPPILLLPGQILGINIPFTGSGDASVSLYWVVV